MCLYMLTPLLNKALRSISKAQLGFAIMFLLTVWTLLPETIGRIDQLENYGFSYLGWFVLLYMIGAYLKLYSCPLYGRKRLTFVLLGACIVIKTIARIGWTLLGAKGGDMTLMQTVAHNICAVIGDYGPSAHTPMPLVISLLLLIAFQQINISKGRWIYPVAASTFGIYLLHDGPWLRYYLWDNICHTPQMSEQEPWVFLLWSLVCITAVFVVCCIVEMLRRYLIEIPFFRWRPVKQVMDKVSAKVDAVLNGADK